MTDPLLIIIGPTATGKTNLALSLAKEFNGELISADSRQIYQGMDIGTGKDIPPDFRKIKSSLTYQNQNIIYYSNRSIRIWGYDLAAPSDDFNISRYHSACSLILKDIRQRQKLPILVGGTGHYIRAVINPPETISIPPNLDLRLRLEKLTVFELQLKLQAINPLKWEQMNQSDQKNPRRLVRAIEVSLHQQSSVPSVSTPPDSAPFLEDRLVKYQEFWIGLQLDKATLHQRIRARVHQRIEAGMIDEVKKLNLNKLDSHLPAPDTIGYRQIQAFLDKQISLEEATDQWIIAEKQYAKRQITWFNRLQLINWFDPTHSQSHSAIVALVNDWYHKTNEQKN